MSSPPRPESRADDLSYCLKRSNSAEQRIPCEVSESMSRDALRHAESEMRRDIYSLYIHRTLELVQQDECVVLARTASAKNTPVPPASPSPLPSSVARDGQKESEGRSSFTAPPKGEVLAPKLQQAKAALVTSSSSPSVGAVPPSPPPPVKRTGTPPVYTTVRRTAPPSATTTTTTASQQPHSVSISSAVNKTAEAASVCGKGSSLPPPPPPPTAPTVQSPVLSAAKTAIKSAAADQPTSVAVATSTARSAEDDATSRRTDVNRSAPSTSPSRSESVSLQRRASAAFVPPAEEDEEFTYDDDAEKEEDTPAAQSAVPAGRTSVSPRCVARRPSSAVLGCDEALEAEEIYAVSPRRESFQLPRCPSAAIAPVSEEDDHHYPTQQQQHSPSHSGALPPRAPRHTSANNNNTSSYQPNRSLPTHPSSASRYGSSPLPMLRGTPMKFVETPSDEGGLTYYSSSRVGSARDTSEGHHHHRAVPLALTPMDTAEVVPHDHHPPHPRQQVEEEEGVSHTTTVGPFDEATVSQDDEAPATLEPEHHPHDPSHHRADQNVKQLPQEAPFPAVTKVETGTSQNTKKENVAESMDEEEAALQRMLAQLSAKAEAREQQQRQSADLYRNESRNTSNGGILLEPENGHRAQDALNIQHRSLIQSFEAAARAERTEEEAFSREILENQIKVEEKLQLQENDAWRWRIAHGAAVHASTSVSPVQYQHSAQMNHHVSKMSGRILPLNHSHQPEQQQQQQHLPSVALTMQTMEEEIVRAPSSMRPLDLIDDEDEDEYDGDEEEEVDGGVVELTEEEMYFASMQNQEDAVLSALLGERLDILRCCIAVEKDEEGAREMLEIKEMIIFKKLIIDPFLEQVRSKSRWSRAASRVAETAGPVSAAPYSYPSSLEAADMRERRAARLGAACASPPPSQSRSGTALSTWMKTPAPAESLTPSRSVLALARAMQDFFKNESAARHQLHQKWMDQWRQLQVGHWAMLREVRASRNTFYQTLSSSAMRHYSGSGGTTAGMMMFHSASSPSRQYHASSSAQGWVSPPALPHDDDCVGDEDVPLMPQGSPTPTHGNRRMYESSGGAKQPPHHYNQQQQGGARRTVPHPPPPPTAAAATLQQQPLSYQEYLAEDTSGDEPCDLTHNLRTMTATPFLPKRAVPASGLTSRNTNSRAAQQQRHTGGGGGGISGTVSPDDKFSAVPSVYSTPRPPPRESKLVKSKASSAGAVVVRTTNRSPPQEAVEPLTHFPTVYGGPSRLQHHHQQQPVSMVDMMSGAASSNGATYWMPPSTSSNPLFLLDQPNPAFLPGGGGGSAYGGGGGAMYSHHLSQSGSSAPQWVMVAPTVGGSTMMVPMMMLPSPPMMMYTPQQPAVPQSRYANTLSATPNGRLGALTTNTYLRPKVAVAAPPPSLPPIANTTYSARTMQELMRIGRYPQPPSFTPPRGYGSGW